MATLTPNVYVNADFWDVVWPAQESNGLPTKFKKLVRGEFLLDKEGNVFSREDLKDILGAWLHDEFGSCPTSFEFIIAP